MSITYTVTVYNDRTEWKNEKGQLHREDGPAIEYTNGNKSWYLNGQLHREDGPAIECTNGDKVWYLNGKLHREGGPAIEWNNGYKEWWLNGKRHRADGPAVTYADGTKAWWLNGKYYTEEQFNKQVNKHTSCNGKIVEIDGKKYELKEI
jgi:hypothetical protein